MTEVLLLLPFILAVGFIIGNVFSEFAEEKTKTAGTEEKSEKIETEEPLSPMALRNGYGVTRDKNPTFAEQWVNIMNYSGESQMEEGYEEENNDPEGYLE